MMPRWSQYMYIYLVCITISFGYAQDFSVEDPRDVNIYFKDSILLNRRNDNGTPVENAETIFINYYKGLDLIEKVEDSLKFIFYVDYSGAMALSKLYDESNMLAKKGVQLSKEVPNLPEGIELGFYYNQLAFNYLELHKYDSVTWAYQKNIEINDLQGAPWRNVSGYNNLGYHYFLNIKNNDSALYYLNKLNEHPYRDLAYSNSITLEWSVKDNIALVYLDQGRYSEAGALFKEIYTNYGRIRRGYLWRERWLRAGLQYVDVELHLGNLSRAGNTLREIEGHFYSITDFHTAPQEYYPSKLLLLKLKQQYARKTGNFKESDLLGETYLKLQDSINFRNNDKLLGDFNLIRNIGLYNARNALQKGKALNIIEKENLALDLKSKATKTYWAITIIALLAIMSLGYFYFRKMRRYNEYQNEMQVEYSQNLIQTQEEERRRVARELHDSVGQKLMLLSKTTKKLGNSMVENLASSTLDEVREISRGLHPSNLERLGITMAINALIYEINANTDLFFSDEIDNIDNLLPNDFELHLFRIIQEVLNNIIKHSEAKAVKIEIKKSEEALDILISDNGKGFDVESKLKHMGLGMKTLFERAKIINATLNLNSSIGKGTVMTLNITQVL